ncbi:P-type conjugative transfer protein TrbJ [Comamonas endophytica]|uniref:P-type conjugative transfer protein TrbJ n=1 Tax=Comamonas endophytica TaxID=2949090 RepID=A0ABY6GH48_9BURK|nr:MULTISPECIES: P-type conjugative transfer protein TrbJ [unclassified Acidovorax]MCD2514402.1 P-type conjugative transfer protein TrbJ [Acidovorax sp. D4N7]UYG53692.1 P-type conjugative transfer protein TrbJ [Acidovorax sp. 5MLIR]
MKRHFPKFFAINTAVAWAVCVCAARAGGIPVFDAGNFAQTTKSAVEAVAQTAKQIEQYDLQLKQYANMLENSKVPPRYVWDQAQVTISRLRTAMGTLDHYRQQAGSLEKHLQRFKDVDGYQSSACFNTDCSAAQRAQVSEEQGRLGAQTQKSANDALLRSLDRQHQSMRSDALQLKELQEGAQGAAGQMQALGAANQLASHVAYQLQQIRAVLIAQSTALAARQQVQADREALAQASRKGALAPRLGDTPNPLNWLSIKR